MIFANAPEDNPFMAGSFLGEGAPDSVIHIGVSGPGVVRRALERTVADVSGLRTERDSRRRSRARRFE